MAAMYHMPGWGRLLRSETRLPVVLLRLSVGLIFLSEGLQKFLFPESLGPGRFSKIGIPFPDITAQLVGATEVLCGSLVVLGLLTRLAAMPLIGIMVVALASTKVSIFLESGLWKAAHEARTDFSMLMTSLFLVFSGGGRWSIDSFLTRRIGAS